MGWWRRWALVMLLSGLSAGGWAADSDRLNSEEADVRFLLEQAARDQSIIEASGLLYRDKALESYLDRVVGRLHGSSASAGDGFTIRMIKDPHLNAFTYPDGTCYIQIGILARIRNEAQLAALLAHEMAHIINRHAVNGIRRLHHRPGSAAPLHQDGDARDPSSAQMRQRLHYAWIAYHHEAEFEADRHALKLMIRAGYDPYEALKLFGLLAEEMSQENYQEPLLHVSHPRLDARIEKCQEYLTANYTGFRGPVVAEGNFEKRIQDLLLENIGLDLQTGRFTQALQASARYLSLRPKDARIHFLRGEIVRQRNAEGNDVNEAVSCYNRAITLDGDYAEPHRALGMLYYKTGLSEQARPYLKTSRALAPQASEHAYIRQYLSRLGP